jgi:lysyl-tRNA synthetase class 2
MTSSLTEPSRLALREIHQLRSVPSLKGRLATVRGFVKEGKWGLVDCSGAVWPVFIDVCIESLQGGSQPESKLEQWDWVELRFDGVPKSGYVMAASSGRILTRSRASELHQRFVHWLDHLHFDTNGYARSAPFPELSAHQIIHQAKQRLRDYFRALGYLELEAPLCVPSGGIERYMQVFETSYRDYNGKEHPLQLPTSPEFALKKCLSQGYPKVFSLAQSFRNGGEISPWHRPQFTMLEWYTVGKSLSEMIDQTQEIVEIVSQSLALSGPAPLARTDIRSSVEVLRIEDLYGEFFGIDLRKVLASNNAADFYASLNGKAISVRPDDSLDELFWKSFLDIIEPSLKQRDWVFLTGFPVGYASLAQSEPGGLFAERFELFSCGVEICNGYFELTDVDVMRNRFDEILLRRSDLRGDKSFESAMQAGIPPCAGNALGLERLVSVIMGAESLVAGHGLDSFSSQ